MTLTERERKLRARHQLAVIRHAQEVTNNVAKTRRYYGITPSSILRTGRHIHASPDIFIISYENGQVNPGSVQRKSARSGESRPEDCCLRTCSQSRPCRSAPRIRL